MKFLVDVSTGKSVAEYLKTTGHDVIAMSQINPKESDLEILALAEKETRILITNDKDFGELVFRSGKAHYGVILMRLNNESAANRVHVAKILVEKYADHLEKRFVVVTDDEVRFHPLPKIPR